MGADADEDADEENLSGVNLQKSAELEQLRLELGPQPQSCLVACSLALEETKIAIIDTLAKNANGQQLLVAQLNCKAQHLGNKKFVGIRRRSLSA